MTSLADLVDVSQRVGATSSRRAKIAEIARLLRGMAPDEVALAVAYLSGETRQGRRGIGYALIRAAHPDASASAPALGLRDADAALDAIMRTSGAGSVAERTRLLGALLARASTPEQEFLVRLLLGELRQGALEGLMIEAVAAAAQLPAGDVRRAAMLGGGIAAVAGAALQHGAAGLARFTIRMFQPLAPMLAQPADDLADALARVPLPALEWKLDGARVQAHRDGADVRIYTRTGNDVTAAAPEIVEAVRGLPVATLILDGEAIALRADGTPYAFQDTMRRFGRMLEIDSMRAKMPLSVFFFDCLRLGADDLLGQPARVRFQAMTDALPSSLIIPRLVAADATAAQAFYDDALARGHEGVMVKGLDAPYDPGARSALWLKVKRTHTLDLVVLAAEWGHGRRHGWLSNLHLGARDPATGGFVMLGKTFKGMTDSMLEWQTKELLARAVERNDWVVHVRPELVVEITFNDLQASPRYPGSLALRFARVKGYRPDKKPEDADTIETVKRIYAAQGA
jgi:DNA ligase 1